MREDLNSSPSDRAGWLVIQAVCREEVGRERTFDWLGHCRRLAKDFEALTNSHPAFVKWAMIRLIMRRIAKASHGPASGKWRALS
jgi:hypothetical protein